MGRPCVSAHHKNRRVRLGGIDHHTMTNKSASCVRVIDVVVLIKDGVPYLLTSSKVRADVRVWVHDETDAAPSDVSRRVVNKMLAGPHELHAIL